MKKTVTINIASVAFYIDEDAYEELKRYQQKLESWFGNRDGGAEIIKDIESRIAELFAQRVNPGVSVISIDHVKEVIDIMGQPEDFEGEINEEMPTGETGQASAGATYRPRKQFYRDIDNKVLGGVCSGIAALININPLAVRLLFIILPFLSMGVIILIYLILWIAVPPAITSVQKLEMRGEDITISSIEKTVKDEYNQLKGRLSNYGKKKVATEPDVNRIDRMNRTDKSILVVAAVIGCLVLFRKVAMHWSFGNITINTPFLNFTLIPYTMILSLIASIVLFIMGLNSQGTSRTVLLVSASVLMAFVLAKFIGALAFAPWFFTMF